VHVLLEGVRPLLEGDAPPERLLSTRIRDVCAVIMMDGTAVRNAAYHAPKHGVRFFWQNEMVRQLQDLGKIKQPRSSEIAQLPPDATRVFKRRGHDDVTDDAHLYSLARTFDRHVVTRDENLLRRRKDIEKATGVTTHGVGEVLEEGEG
jgi:hypothetical protein